MEVKDWILLLVPILCNGLVLFVLQKISEKRQITRGIKTEYLSLFRRKIDLSLDLHTKATRLVNDGKTGNDGEVLKTIQRYIDSTLDVYYYYVQNKILFESFTAPMEQISKLVSNLIRQNGQKVINPVELSSVLNEIRDELMSLKNECIKLHF